MITKVVVKIKRNGEITAVVEYESGKTMRFRKIPKTVDKFTREHTATLEDHGANLYMIYEEAD